MGGVHTPAVLQVAVSEPEERVEVASQAMEQEEPEGKFALHELYMALVVRVKSVIQLGLHVPSGVDSVPLLQRMGRLLEAT